MDYAWNLLGNPSFLVGVKCGVLTSLAFYYLTSRQSAKAGKYEENEEDENSMSATGNYKLVLVVRSDLKMGKGKIAAQVEEYFKLELVLWFQWFIL